MTGRPIAANETGRPAAAGAEPDSASPAIDDAQLSAIVDGLAGPGFAVLPGALGAPLIAGLRRDALARAEAGLLRDASIGRDGSAGGGQTGHIRQVRTSWLDGGTAAEAEFLALAETIRLALNRQLMLGLFELEAQFLVYDPGGFYARHRDSFEGARNRVVSLVAYLNEEWQEADGGILSIWPDDAEPDAPPSLRVTPHAGTVVLMMSETIPHQVEPACRQRVAIAGWWRVNQSTGGRVDPPR